MDSIINQLLKQWPRGAVATSAWLQECGVSRQLARRYVGSGWLEALGRGAFVRSGERVNWLGGVFAMQVQLGLGVHVAAETALSLKGLGHHLPLGENARVHLFGDRQERLPAWFVRHDWGVRVVHGCPRLFEASVSTGFTEVQHGELAIRVAAPERAMLEVCGLATTNAAVEHVVELMGGLGTLRPKVVQGLLEGCRSVKAKRLFLWAAEASGHAWLEGVAMDRVALGEGKRCLYRGGRLDAKYRITVPRRESVDV